MVRAWHHAQWASFRAAIVEMHSNCRERLENGEGWLYVEDALLFGPTRALGVRDAVTDRNAQS